MNSNEFTRKGKLINKLELRESKGGVKYINFTISVSKNSGTNDNPKWESVLHKFVTFREKAEFINRIPDGTEIIVKGDLRPIRTYDLLPGDDNEKKKEILSKLKVKGIDLWRIDGFCGSNVKEIIPIMGFEKENKPSKSQEKVLADNSVEDLDDLDDDLPF